MTLYEIGLEYEESAKLLRKKMHDIRLELKTTTNADEIWKLKRRLADLTPLLTDCNKLSVYCRRYYDRGFYINDGAFGRRGEREKTTTNKLDASTDLATDTRNRVDRKTKNCGSRVSAKWENVCRLSEGTRSKQKHCLQELL